MSRITPAQAASFPSGGRNSFFTLSNDQDSAIVRFAYNNENDIFVYMTHEVQGPDGRRRVVGCLRSDNSEPESNCPFCSAGIPLRKSLYLNVYNEATKEMQVWQRNESFFKQNLRGLLDTYKDTPLCSLPVKVIRNGAKGDPTTKYQVIPMPVDGVTMDQLGETIDVEKEGIVKVLSFQEMENYLRTGQLPQPANQQGGYNNPGIQPRGNDFGQPARVQDYNQPAPMQGYQQPAPAQAPTQGYYQQPVGAPINSTRRTINNNGNGGY